MRYIIRPNNLGLGHFRLINKKSGQRGRGRKNVPTANCRVLILRLGNYYTQKTGRDKKNNMYIESSGHLEIKFVTFLNTISLIFSDEISVVYFSVRSKMPKMNFYTKINLGPNLDR